MLLLLVLFSFVKYCCLKDAPGKAALLKARLCVPPVIRMKSLNRYPCSVPPLMRLLFESKPILVGGIFHPEQAISSNEAAFIFIPRTAGSVDVCEIAYPGQ